jgi:biotin synthase
MLNSFISQLAKRVLDGYQINYSEALKLTRLEDSLEDLLYAAYRIRRHYHGTEVDFCSIINAKSGRCPEDCKFCAQSAHYCTSAKQFPLIETEIILKGAQAARDIGAYRYGIITSGRRLREDELEKICAALDEIARKTDILRCASLGELTPNILNRLKAAGLSRYHHNLETSARFFPSICSTHSYQDRLNTARLVKRAGLELCSGGIFGMGEDMQDRLELAFTLRELGADSIPLNFLAPIPGTPLQDYPPLPPKEILKIIALFRFVLPDKAIKVCGGRETNLRDLQSWIYYAGANGSMLGNYLTTLGRPADEDLRLVNDLGLQPKRLA